MKTPTALAALLFAAGALADTSEAVRCREVAFSHAVESRDAAAFTTFIDPDARFAGGGVLRGPQEVAAGWAGFFDPAGPSLAWRPRVVEVLEEDGLALTRGPYRLRATDPGGSPVERWGTFNSVWRRGDDGVWRVLFDAGSPGAEPAEEDRALLAADPGCGGR